MAWLSGWTYRKSITLSRASGTVTNYQMKLLVGESSGAVGEDVDCGAKILTSFNDLRFTTSNGTTLLDYWIESLSGTTPNQLATVWIEFDSIGTGATTFYMYYGNAGASAASNGVNTFLFFDDFASSLDTSKWDDRAGSPSTSGGLLVLAASDRVRSTGFSRLYDLRFKCRAKMSHTNGVGRIGMSNSAVATTFNADESAYHNPYNDAKVYYTNSHNGTGSYGALLDPYAADTFYLMEFRWHSGHVFYSVNGAAETDTATNIADAACNPRMEFDTASKTCSVDWVFVSQRLSTEPAWGSWGSEVQYVLKSVAATVATSSTVARKTKKTPSMASVATLSTVARKLAWKKSIVASVATSSIVARKTKKTPSLASVATLSTVRRKTKKRVSSTVQAVGIGFRPINIKKAISGAVGSTASAKRATKKTLTTSVGTVASSSWGAVYHKVVSALVDTVSTISHRITWGKTVTTTVGTVGVLRPFNMKRTVSGTVGTVSSLRPFNMRRTVSATVGTVARVARKTVKSIAIATVGTIATVVAQLPFILSAGA